MEKGFEKYFKKKYISFASNFLTPYFQFFKIRRKGWTVLNKGICVKAPNKQIWVFSKSNLKSCRERFEFGVKSFNFTLYPKNTPFRLWTVNFSGTESSRAPRWFKSIFKYFGLYQPINIFKVSSFIIQQIWERIIINTLSVVP